MSPKAVIMPMVPPHILSKLPKGIISQMVKLPYISRYIIAKEREAAKKQG
jgi:hypothetical protein